MTLANLLQSGHGFTPDEYQLRLKYFLFNSLIGSNIFLVSVAAVFRFAANQNVQGIVDVSYVFLAFLLAVIARRSKKAFPILVFCILFLSVVIVSIAYKQVANDIAGISWFLVLVTVVFYLTDRKSAYIFSFVSVFLAICISVTNEVKEYNIIEIVYGVIPLLVTFTFVQFYEKRNTLSKERLDILNRELKKKVTHTTSELSVVEERFRNLVENLSDWVWEINENGIFLYSSPAVEKIIGYRPSEIVGRSYREFGGRMVINENRRFMVNFINHKKSVRCQPFKVRHKGGNKVMLEVSCSPVFDEKGTFLGYRGVTRDITGRLASEKEHNILKERLHQAQKMEAIGTLAGGIAHDFNNILSAILGYAEITAMDLPEESPAGKNIDQILIAGSRASKLVKQILTFSRKGEYGEEPLRIDLITKEALKMLRSSLPVTIEMKINIDPECGEVLADPTNIHQIVVNLCTNAAQAIGEAKGLLEVTLKRVDFDSGQVAANPHLREGSFVVLMVRDNGNGMDEEIAARVFEPYFTTKKQEEGTGLGLAVIHGIVQHANGFIQLESCPGKGTSFRIYLPRLPVEQVAIADTGEKAALPTGSERILIVDDEPDLTDVAEVHLSRLGYKVTTRTKSTEALELFLADPDAFDLVITDQTMPDVTGAELVTAMLKVKPDLPVLLYTGYTAALSEEDAYALGVKSFIMKPMSKKLLAKTVRHLLDE